MTDRTETGTHTVRVLLYFAMMTLLAMLAIWGLLGRTVAEKIATSLALPCGIIWYLLMGCMVLSMSSRRRRLALTMFTVWLVYTASGNGFVAGLVVGSLENPFVDTDPLQQGPFDTVVVLGGGGSIGANGRYQGNSSGDRILLAAQLYHAGIAPRLICTGKRIVSMDAEGPDPSEITMDLLIGLGVAESAIERLGGRNTSEEMRNLGERFRGTDLRVGLVTSAWHLPRALGLAKRNGFEPKPLPADFLGSRNGSWTAAQILLACIPQADNLQVVSRVTKEYFGRMVGR